MKIAFWSEEKQVETAFHMALVACTSVLMYPITAAVVSGGYQNDSLEKNFLGHRSSVFGQTINPGYGRDGQSLLAAEQQEYFLTSGFLIREAERGFDRASREREYASSNKRQNVLPSWQPKGRTGMVAGGCAFHKVKAGAERCGRLF